MSTAQRIGDGGRFALWAVAALISREDASGPVSLIGLCATINPRKNSWCEGLHRNRLGNP